MALQLDDRRRRARRRSTSCRWSGSSGRAWCSTSLEGRDGEVDHGRRGRGGARADRPPARRALTSFWCGQRPRRVTRGARLHDRGPGVTAEATYWLFDRGVRVMGIDAWGWDAPLNLQAEPRASGRAGHLLGGPPGRPRLLPDRAPVRSGRVAADWLYGVLLSAKGSAVQRGPGPRGGDRALSVTPATFACLRAHWVLQPEAHRSGRPGQSERESVTTRRIGCSDPRRRAGAGRARAGTRLHAGRGRGAQPFALFSDSRARRLRGARNHLRHHRRAGPCACGRRRSRWGGDQPAGRTRSDRQRPAGAGRVGGDSRLPPRLCAVEAVPRGGRARTGGRWRALAQGPGGQPRGRNRLLRFLRPGRERDRRLERRWVERRPARRPRACSAGPAVGCLPAWPVSCSSPCASCRPTRGPPASSSTRPNATDERDGTYTWVDVTGRVGLVARALVFAVVGYFLVRAAVSYNPNTAVGLDGALRKVHDEPHGTLLLAAGGRRTAGLCNVLAGRGPLPQAVSAARR